MTERLNLLSYRRNLRRRSTSKSDYTSASGSQCFISMARSIAMARQTVHRAKSEAGYAPAPPLSGQHAGRRLCLLKPGNRCFGYPGKVVGQQVTRAGLHPLVEVGLFELAVVPGLHDLKIFIADVLDRVPEALRNVGDIARHELGHLAAPARDAERHLPLAAQIVMPLVRVHVPVQVPHGPWLDGHHAA